MSWLRAQQLRWQIAIGCGVLLMCCTSLTCIGAVVAAMLSDLSDEEVVVQSRPTVTALVPPTATANSTPTDANASLNPDESTTLKPLAPVTEVASVATEVVVPATPTWPPTRTPSAKDYVAEFEAYMLGFNQTSWYSSITGYGTSFGRVLIETNLYPDWEAEVFARPICSAASGFVFARTNAGKFDGVVIRGQGGQVIMKRNSFSDDCSK